MSERSNSVRGESPSVVASSSRQGLTFARSKSDAANAKVAELRTMVGERYRDLLAAADSIVRMRGAADKLLDRLEGVESAVLSAGEALKGSLFSQFAFGTDLIPSL